VIPESASHEKGREAPSGRTYVTDRDEVKVNASLNKMSLEMNIGSFAPPPTKGWDGWCSRNSNGKCFLEAFPKKFGKHGKQYPERSVCLLFLPSDCSWSQRASSPGNALGAVKRLPVALESGTR
jgi:hypothetical protein